MFVSHPQYEFEYPIRFVEPGAQYWRVMELNLHAPWFLLSVEHVAPDEPDVTFVRTLCVGWERDLVATLRNIDASRVKGLVAMLPGADPGQWSSREIREIWLCGEHAVLIDAVGKTYAANPMVAPASNSKMKLLLRINAYSR